MSFYAFSFMGAGPLGTLIWLFGRSFWATTGHCDQCGVYVAGVGRHQSLQSVVA